jgi:hypothetical protein
MISRKIPEGLKPESFAPPAARLKPCPSHAGSVSKPFPFESTFCDLTAWTFCDLKKGDGHGFS